MGSVPPGSAYTQDFAADKAGALPVAIASYEIFFGHTVLDSLDLKLLEIELAGAELEVRETNFLHRLTPQIHLSANFSMKDIIFVDPNTFVPYLLPKDAYRVSIGLSVNEIFDFDKHTRAEIGLNQLRIKNDRLKQQQNRDRSISILQLIELDSLCLIAGEEINLKNEILKYSTLCFQQGKIEFDEFLKSKLDLMIVKKSLAGLNSRRAEIFWKLYGGRLR